MTAPVSAPAGSAADAKAGPGRIGTAGVALLLVALGACRSAPPRIPDREAACLAQRPYAATSVWNTPIGADPSVDPETPRYQRTLTATGVSLTSDVDQYTIGLHCVTNTTPRTSVKFSGYYSSYLTGTRTGYGYAPLVPDLPIPAEIAPPTGTDAQVVIWDQVAGIEYGFWQFAWSNGRATATNGYAIRTDDTSTGRLADGLAGRGAGLPYLGGLVRPDEIATGHIDHALAFGYRYPSKTYVFPASKSDGKGTTGRDLPEGIRLQLDPTLTPDELTRLGVTTYGLVLAAALQEYGMFVVDNSGSAKIYLQDRPTAGWDTTINRTILGTIPWTRFRIVTTGPPG